MNWSKLFKDNVLGRGYEHYSQGRAAITGVENGIISADVSDGDTFKIRIIMNKGGIADMTCTCQLACEGSNCSHMAAALFAYYKCTPDSCKDSTDEVDELLSAADPDTLRRFLSSVLKDSKELFLKFKSLDSSFFSMPQYRAYIDDLIAEYSINGAVEHHSAGALARRLTEILSSNISHMIDNGLLHESFALLSYLTRKLENTDIDDSGGDIETFTHLCTDCAITLLGKCSIELKREIFNEIIEKIYASDCAISDEFYEELLIHSFREPEFAPQKIEYADRNICFYMNRPSGDVRVYRVEYWLCCKLQIMYDSGCSEDRLRSFLRANYRFRKIRLWFIDHYINTKQFDAAVTVINDSIKYDAAIPGSEKTYKLKLKEIYRLSGNRAEYLDLLWEIVKNPELWSFPAYTELRSFYSDKAWITKRETIFSHITNSYVLAELYAAEKMYPELLDSALKCNGLYLADKYIDILFPLYPDKLSNKYIDEVNKLARMATNREAYKQLVTILRRILKFPDGKNKVSEIVSQWRAQYKRRRAMMEELDKIILGE